MDDNLNKKLGQALNKYLVGGLKKSKGGGGLFKFSSMKDEQIDRPVRKLKNNIDHNSTVSKEFPGIDTKDRHL